MADSCPKLPGMEILFDELPCGLLVTAADGTILRANDTFCRWVGHSKTELEARRRLPDLFTVGARLFHHTHWLPMLQMGSEISELKLDVQCKDGRTVPMLFNVARKASDGGSHDVVSAFLVQDRHKYEHELLAARKRADSLVLLQQDRALFAEQMVGIVSHDLRNPLSVVLLAARLLASAGESLTAEKSQRMLANIIRAAERSQRLIEELLDFAVARVGPGLKVTRRPVDLHQIAERAVDELGLAFPGRTMQLRRSGDGRVVADADRLAQVLGNLVGNALAYGDETSPVIISTTVADDVARISVHNEGVPIPPGTLATMFEPMVRGQAKAGSAVRSVGLGLFIVRAIAIAHGGEVAVTSTVGEGTRFVVTFPPSMPD